MKIKRFSIPIIAVAVLLVAGITVGFATSNKKPGNEPDAITDSAPAGAGTSESAVGGVSGPAAADSEPGKLVSVKLSDENKYTPEEWEDILRRIERGEITVEPEDSAVSVGGTVVSFTVDFGTHMDVELAKGGVLLAGRETWEKGDEIVFRIRCDEAVKLYAGIIPAESMDSGWGYNDYGFAVGKELDVSAEVREVSMTVPETGEYGIIVRHIMDENDEEDLTAPDSPEMDDSQSGGQSAAETDMPITDALDTVAFGLEINKVFENPLIAPDRPDNSAGDNISNAEWVWPVEGCETVTSAFGKRVHPISGKTVESDHIDIAGNGVEGAAVYAALSGTVSEAGFDAEQGNYIVIAHDNGIETIYRHLNEILVTAGNPVVAGDTIGTVGKTGTATGPCLAFCVRVDGAAVNPLEYYQ